MRRNDTGNLVDEYPYVSPCGKELNFISPDDPLSAFSFTSLDEKNKKLSYAGEGLFTQSFDPSSLSYSQATGRVYHPIITSSSSRYLKNELGLLHPTLCEDIVLNRLLINEKEATKGSGLGSECGTSEDEADGRETSFSTEFDGKLFPLKLI